MTSLPCCESLDSLAAGQSASLAAESRLLLGVKGLHSISDYRINSNWITGNRITGNPITGNWTTSKQIAGNQITGNRITCNWIIGN